MEKHINLDSITFLDSDGREKISPRPCEICKKVKFLKGYQDLKRTLVVEICSCCFTKKAK